MSNWKEILYPRRLAISLFAGTMLFSITCLRASGVSETAKIYIELSGKIKKHQYFEVTLPDMRINKLESSYVLREKFTKRFDKWEARQREAAKIFGTPDHAGDFWWAPNAGNSYALLFDGYKLRSLLGASPRRVIKIPSIYSERPSHRYAWSPDGKKLALGYYMGSKSALVRLRAFAVPDMQVIYEETFEESIGDLVWSPDSVRLALLMDRQRCHWWWPWQFLSAIAGHPIPYDSFYLKFIRPGESSSLEQRVGKNIPYGSGLILWE